MAEDLYFLGTVPLYTKEYKHITNELVFVHADDNNILVPKDYRDSAKLIGSSLNLSYFSDIFTQQRAYVRIDKKFLMHEMIYSVPAEQFIFILDFDTLDACVTKHLEHLIQKGYLFSWLLKEQSFKNITQTDPLLSLCHTLFIDMQTLNNLGRLHSIKQLKDLKKRLVISSIQSQEELNLFHGIRDTLFLGTFFEKVTLVKPKLGGREDLDKVIELCNLLSTDTSTKNISHAFKEAPHLSLQLIQYINSSSFALKERVSSVDRLIALIGRERLKQWLLLTLYTNNQNNPALKPLLALLDKRLNMLEKIATLVPVTKDRHFYDKLNFLGLLSLIEAIMQQPLTDIINKFHICNELKEALLEKKNLLGEIFEFVLALERFDLLKIQSFIQSYQIRPKLIESYMKEAVIMSRHSA